MVSIQGWTVPMEYDPLLGKLVVWAPARKDAISRMARALDECHIGGIRNNIGFFMALMRDPEFAAGAIHTGFIQEFLDRRSIPETPPDAELAQILSEPSRLHRKRKRRPVLRPPPLRTGCARVARSFFDNLLHLARSGVALFRDDHVLDRFTLLVHHT